jgi:hypothetical protein
MGPVSLLLLFFLFSTTLLLFSSSNFTHYSFPVQIGKIISLWVTYTQIALHAALLVSSNMTQFSASVAFRIFSLF